DQLFEPALDRRPRRQRVEVIARARVLGAAPRLHRGVVPVLQPPVVVHDLDAVIAVGDRTLLRRRRFLHRGRLSGGAGNRHHAQRGGDRGELLQRRTGRAHRVIHVWLLAHDGLGGTRSGRLTWARRAWRA